MNHPRNLPAFVLLSLLTAPFSSSSFAQSLWTGATSSSGNWNSITAPGWTTGGVPDLVGATGTMAGNGSKTTVQSIAAGVTVGSLTRDVLGSNNGTWTITVTNPITLNQDGAGSGFASLNLSGSSTTTPKLLLTGAGNIVLADNLQINNTVATTLASGSVEVAAPITGTGNVTISNVQTSINAGQIVLGGANSFTGAVTVSKGAVTFSTASAFGNSANAVTIGSSGGGSTTVLATATNLNVSNNITIASGAGGTITIGSNNTLNSSDNIYSGTIALNGNLTVSDSHTGTRGVILSNVVSGTGSLTSSGTGRVILSNSNTYSGDTIVSGSSTLSLLDNAQIRFTIGGNGVNNQVNGTGTLLLAGDFTFDLSGAAALGSWTIVDTSTLAETFASTFSVPGFTDMGNDTWTFGNYTFNESNGMLIAVPEPATGLMAVGGLALVLISTRRRL